MLQIRLHRTGRTKRPHYRVVVAEHRRAAQGPYVKVLGIWDPLIGKLNIDEKELTNWMDRGAKPTDRISRLLKKYGLKHKMIVIHMRPERGPKKKSKKQEVPKTQEGVESDKVSVKADEVPEKQSEKESETSESNDAAEQAKPAENVEPAAKEVNTAIAEGEDQAKSPAGDQA